MRSPHDEILDRWLAAEADGREDDAETALFALFETLPPLAPPVGFADRVLVRAALASLPAPVRRNLIAAPWFRAVVALSLLIVGLALPWLSGVLRSVAGVTGSLWSLADVVRLGMEGLVAVSQGLVAALALWDWLLEIGRPFQAPFATPAAALVMVVCLLVSVAAFHFLRDLISRDRSWTHVESI